MKSASKFSVLLAPAFDYYDHEDYIHEPYD